MVGTWLEGTTANVVMETGLFKPAQDQAAVVAYRKPVEPQATLSVDQEGSERPTAGE
jgi:hypothetical protein